MSDNPLEILKELAELEKPLTKEETIIDTYFNLFWEIASQIKDECFLKGNVLLNKLYKDRARSTLDLDIGLISRELYTTVIMKELNKFGTSLVERGIADNFNVRDDEGRKNGGIDVYDKDGSKIYAVDVELDRTVMLGVVTYCFDGKYVLGSSIERILCDKCLSTLSKRRFKRIKDFFDLYLILTSEVKYDKNKVFELMVAMEGIDRVKELLSNYPFSKSTISSLKALWDSFEIINTSNGRLDSTDFSVIYTEISVLYDKLKFLV